MEIRSVTAEELEKAYLGLSFPEPPAERPYVIVNMVSSADGSVTVVDEKTGAVTERGLGSRFDQRMMRVLRTHADGTLNGAETLRRSGAGSAIDDAGLQAVRTSNGKTANPIAFTLTASGRGLPLDRDDPKSSFFYSRDFDAVLFASEGADEAQLERVRETGRAVEVLPAHDATGTMLRLMRERYKIGLLLCEGGPSVNASLLAEGAVDELFLTLAPKIVGGGKHAVDLDPPLTRGNLVALQPCRILGAPETGELFLHYRFPRG
jgi:riboflavin biosynthesis pyrimidine reductase